MKKPTTLERIYKLKMIIVAGALLLAGISAEILGQWLQERFFNHLVVSAVQGLSDVFFVTGGLGIAVDFFTNRDKEAASVERTRAVISALVPDFTAAVVRGFAAAPDDLKRVATPELLDQLATNALSLRLGDDQFASELYADIRDQAIRAPERWYDVDVTIRLSNALERSANGAPLFNVVVEWEYTTVPTYPVQRFACVSDREEFHDLVTDVPATLPWFMTARAGLDASDPQNYELLSFSVDGESKPIKRSVRRSGQAYSASIGQDIVDAGLPVRIRYVYSTVTPQSGHRLYFEAVQPSRQFSISVDYSYTDIAHMSVTELVSSSHRSQVSRMPEQVDAQVLSIDLPGWLLPKSGFAFVWTLLSEQPATPAPEQRLARTKSS